MALVPRSIRFSARPRTRTANGSSASFFRTAERRLRKTRGDPRSRRNDARAGSRRRDGSRDAEGRARRAEPRPRRAAGRDRGIHRSARDADQRTEQSVRPSSSRRSDPAELGADALRTGTLPGPPSAFVCPECGGALWEVVEGDVLKVRPTTRSRSWLRFYAGPLPRRSRVHRGEPPEREGSRRRRRVVERATLVGGERGAAPADGRTLHSRWPSLSKSYEKIAAECDAQSAVLRKGIDGTARSGAGEQRGR